VGNPHPDEYLGGAQFKIEIDGITVAAFREADGLSVHREVVEYHEGGENTKTHKLLGPTRWSNIVLRRGITDSMDFYDWMKKTIDAATIERKNGAIIATDQKGQPKMRWDFTGGWPCRYEGPRMEALDADLKIELLEIAHDGFEMKKC
jgi:phage tail-like protein